MYRYAVLEIKKLQEKLASHHIENENGKRQIFSGESGIISISISEIVTIIEVSKVKKFF